MRRIVLSIVILITSLSAYSDGCQWKYSAHVTSFNGMSIRSLPTLSSEKIGSVPYWDKVLLCDFHFPEPIYDTINNISGIWEQVRYNGIEGWVFGAYLTKVEIDQNDDPYYGLLFEQDGCGSKNFNPNLNWYGVYSEKNGFTIKEVNINMEKRPNDSGIPVYTNISEKSLFLFGSAEKLTHEFLGGDCQKNFLNQQQTYLYPGQSINIYTSTNHPDRKTVEYNAVGCVIENGYCPKFENYELRISDYRNDKHQNISKDFTQFGECGFVKLWWFGDLNNDGLADPMFLSEGKSGIFTLFLSNKDTSKEFYKRIASGFEGTCY
jgi:hypothetical protein